MTHERCEGCAGGSSRREFLGRVSGAALAAMAGVPWSGGGPDWWPVVYASGRAAGQSEHSYPVPSADGVTIDHEQQVILARFQQRAYAFNLACPHENTALRWRAGDGKFQCPRHESKYQPDGVFVSGRATRNMDRFAIRRDGNSLVVDVGRWFRSDQQPKEWAAAVVSLE
jgi:nitrite reductase/ring-hydroxylating ferredoxin subunit